MLEAVEGEVANTSVREPRKVSTLSTAKALAASPFRTTIDPEREQLAAPYDALASAISARWPWLLPDGGSPSPASLGRIASLQRKHLRVSQSEIARRAGVGRRFVSDFEQGKSTVHLSQALQVLQALDLKITVRPSSET